MVALQLQVLTNLLSEVFSLTRHIQPVTCLPHRFLTDRVSPPKKLIHTISYDLCILAMPLAWLGWEGYTKGWLPGEQPLLLLGWLIPLLIPALGKTHLQIAPLVLVALMVIALRRGRHEISQIVRQ
jgi:hypothetical protein